MTAIVTSKFRIVNAENFKRDILDTSNSVYAFIGKSDPWNDILEEFTDGLAPTPEDTEQEVAAVYSNMIGAKKIIDSGVSNVIPRYDWTSGDAYVAWDDRDPDIFIKQFYVMTETKEIYKCLQAGPSVSFIKPNDRSIDPVELQDGYIWKFIQQPDVNTVQFITNFYIPIRTIASEPVDQQDTPYLDWQRQELSKTQINGKIYTCKVTNGGSNYTSAPTVTIVGDGTGATATATVVEGVVTRITMTNRGSGYRTADLIIEGGGGSGVVAYPVLSPGISHGTDPVTELGGFYVGVTTRYEYDEGEGDFPVGSTSLNTSGLLAFRQVGLIKNPLSADGTNIATAPTYNALKTMRLSSLENLVIGDYITGANSDAVAYIDDIDAGAGLLKYHQNIKTGFKSFAAGEPISGSISRGGSGTIASAQDNPFIAPEYTPNTGDIVFIESRDPINRAATQIEDVKIIIEF